jgi:o-succinylbenzoate synthase
VSRLSLQLSPLRITLRAPLRTSQGALQTFFGVRVRVQGGGHVGWGEAMPVAGRSSETAESIDRLLWQRSVNGLEVPTGLEAILAELETLPHDAPAARYGLELALLDWMARHDGVSVARLLNPHARSKVRVNALIAGDTDEALLRDAQRAIDAGFDTLKIKVGALPLDEDLKRIHALRTALSSTLRLRVDANGAWSEPIAARALRELKALNVEFCEQPVAAEDIPALERLVGLQLCPVAADESVPAMAATVRQESAVRLWVLKPAALGGLIASLRIGQAARARGIDSYVTAGWEGTVARMGALHLAAALEGAEGAHGLATGEWVEGPEGEPRPQQGRLEIPGSPGLGLTEGWR